MPPKPTFNSLREVRAHVRSELGLPKQANVAADKLKKFNSMVQALCEEHGVEFEVSLLTPSFRRARRNPHRSLWRVA